MLPSAFISQMQQLLKDEYVAFEKSLQQEVPVSIRINPKKNFKIDSTEKIPWTQFGYYLNQRPEFVFDPAWHVGAYYVQEASSMFLEQVFAQLFQNHSALNVLDLCAAPGGKSTHLLSLLSDNSLLVSNETIGSRNNILRENIIKWGYPNVIVTQNDPKDFQRLPDFFDVIVVDAPCSGEGLFRKDKKAIEEWSDDSVSHCVMRQKRILADVISALKPGGILVYSTCTYNQVEDEEQVQHLICEFGFESIALNIPDNWNIKYECGINGYHFYPHLVKGEGFFMSVLKKTRTETTSEQHHKREQKIFTERNRTELDALIKNPAQFEWIHHRDNFHFFLKEKIPALQQALQNLRVTYFGTEASTVKQKLLPLHPLAMSVAFNSNAFNKINVELKEAIQYLRKENIDTEGENGWNIIQHNNLPLGFAKQAGNRINNYYPVEWRIRKK